MDHSPWSKGKRRTAKCDRGGSVHDTGWTWLIFYRCRRRRTLEESEKWCGETEWYSRDAGRTDFGSRCNSTIWWRTWICAGRFLWEWSGRRYIWRWHLSGFHDTLQCSAILWIESRKTVSTFDAGVPMYRHQEMRQLPVTRKILCLKITMILRFTFLERLMTIISFVLQFTEKRQEIRQERLNWVGRGIDRRAGSQV